MTTSPVPARRPDGNTSGTVAQAAAVLGVTPQRIHQLLAEGQLELAFKAPGLRGAKYVTARSLYQLKEKRAKK